MSDADETVSPCRLLTVLGRTAAQVGAQPAGVIASDDVWSELERLVEAVQAAQRAASTVRASGLAGRACAEDLRLSSKVTIELLVAHDDAGEAVMGAAVTNLERLLDDSDVDVVETSTRWQALELGPVPT